MDGWILAVCWYAFSFSGLFACSAALPGEQWQEQSKRKEQRREYDEVEAHVSVYLFSEQLEWRPLIKWTQILNTSTSSK